MQRVSDQDARIIDRVRTARAEADDDRQAPGQAREARRRKHRQPDRGAPSTRCSRVKGQLVDRRDAYAQRALQQVDRARQHARRPPAPRGRPRARWRRRARRSRPSSPRLQNGSAPGRRRSDPARLGRADLARQRPDRLARSACAGAGCTRASTSRCRPARRCTPPSPAGADRRLGRRLRQLHLHPAHGGGLSTCYGHQSSIGVSVGQSVSQGQVIGYSRLHRPLLRPARALRDAHQRHARQPDGLPLARRYSGERCSPSSTSSASPCRPSG